MLCFSQSTYRPLLTKTLLILTLHFTQKGTKSISTDKPETSISILLLRHQALNNCSKVSIDILTERKEKYVNCQSLDMHSQLRASNMKNLEIMLDRSSRFYDMRYLSMQINTGMNKRIIDNSQFGKRLHPKSRLLETTMVRLPLWNIINPVSGNNDRRGIQAKMPESKNETLKTVNALRRHLRTLLRQADIQRNKLQKMNENRETMRKMLARYYVRKSGKDSKLNNFGYKLRQRRRHSMSINSELISLADVLRAKEDDRAKAFRQHLLAIGR